MSVDWGIKRFPWHMRLWEAECALMAGAASACGSFLSYKNDISEALNAKGGPAADYCA
jgi:hypothetical protein